jgi:FecR protein
MKLSRLMTIGGFFLAGVLSLPAWAARTAQPGSLNYTEGQVVIGDRPVDPQSIGTIALQRGERLSTKAGKAEILLTPGGFLRLDDSSSVRMTAAGLTHTEVALEQGRAMVEVTDLHAENDLRVQENGHTVQLVKTGLYGFDADQDQVRVFSGKAVTFDDDRKVTIDGGHQLDFNAPGKLKAREFDKDQYKQTDLYRWSSLRSSYLAEANVDAARSYTNDGYYGPGWIGAGWYWDPWFATYTFIPADGIFYSPFGWGFFSPPLVFRAPVFFVGPPVVHRFGPTFRPPIAVRTPTVMNPPVGPIRRFPSRPVVQNPGGFPHGGAGGNRGVSSHPGR